MAGSIRNATGAALAALLITLPADEGVRYPPYRDLAGVLTVCYGHTGKDIEMRTYTEAECLELLKKDTEIHMNIVQKCSKRPLPAHKLVAYTSFNFNTGGWCTSRSNREWNAGNDAESCRAMAYAPNGSPAWSYVNGNQFVKGLHARRIREMEICNNPSLPQLSGH